MEPVELDEHEKYACPAVGCADTFDTYGDYLEHYKREHISSERQ